MEKLHIGRYLRHKDTGQHGQHGQCHLS